MFKRLIESLTGKPTSTETPAPEAATSLPAQPERPELIPMYDVHGRVVQISRAEWRDKMLLPQLQAKWNNADELYGLIVNALNDGFCTEIDAASRQLVAIDPTVERGHVIRAIVLMKNGALGEAERVLLDASAK